jgi:hypothetical protein
MVLKWMVLVLVVGISTNGESTTLIYVDGTQGWTSILDNTTNKYGAAICNSNRWNYKLFTCGDYKIHIFTSDGCFSVSCAGNPAGSDTVDYLVVAGGGGGGGPDGYSGGGGAVVLELSNSYLYASTHNFTFSKPNRFTSFYTDLSNYCRWRWCSNPNGLPTGSSLE